MTEAGVDHHAPVMLEEAVAALNIKPEGVYIDGTFGRGGHAQRILDALNDDGRLLAFDKDSSAVDVARARFASDDRFSIVHGSFAQLSEVAAERSLVRKIDGVLLDLGVSSPQLDDPGRGFSFSADGPLDMRMDASRGMTASEWLAAADEGEIADVLHEFGEERFARRIAREIVRRCNDGPIERTAELADLVARACPVREKHKHPATRTFQAIRIVINRELDDLRDALRAALDVLARGARIVTISFHSLEDRIVKRFMRDESQGPRLPKGLPVTHEQVQGRIKMVGRAVRATAQEVQRNPRARSAVMRVAEVLA